ncbi:efflux RND transporter periplasmic adaptor subunit [Terriglobus saanensis]|uniref:Efflux transporter, RND family, MFP subunit n=1 Tax=Terriglobus saanensis (strain ATCC BAA-1853 / DSM 23119 / SP1PR4) TaxID=401053 RepID=E8UYE3_TERSS|nr:efflux RND transporter periplasmic adaptor subunit [Terriglobus saanensis]ADV82031.1 efflux transporter, RND family, MFP subunit [Terriglobus saanensis SP1PR4]
MPLTALSPDGRWNHASGRVLSCVLVVGGLATLSGCQKDTSKAAAPIVPEVIVAQVSCQQLGQAEEFTGRVEAVNTVEVRPRVSGYLQRVNFREGDMVHRGDLLFELDPRPFQAEVDRLSGDLEVAQAEVARTDADQHRAERLRDNEGMSREEYDRRVAAHTEAGAKVSTAEAALRAANLRLSFTRITAAIDGRIGRAQVTEGNLVQEGPAQIIPLTTLLSVNPVYVYFDVDEASYLTIKQLPGAGVQSALLGLADETGFPHKGQLSFVDNQVNRNTGTIRLRATFANSNLRMTPGLFARIRLEENKTYRGCLARDEAVVTDLDQKYVYVLSRGNSLVYRPVTLGPLQNGLRVIRSGLMDSDVIVISGLQRVRPGINVIPKRVPMEPASPTKSSRLAVPKPLRSMNQASGSNGAGIEHL